MNARIYIIALVLAGLSFGCTSTNKSDKKEDILAGEIPVSVDETLLPLFLEHKTVFESSYYNASVKVLANPEVAAINSLLRDEAGMAFLARELTAEELKYFESRKVTGRIYPVGYDAIVVVANVASSDTSIRIPDVVELLKGNKSIEKQLVLDNLNSSVVRHFIKLGNIDKVANTYVETSENGSEGVLHAVSGSTDKVGLISYNQYLSLKSSFPEMEKIRILSVLNEGGGAPKYVLPSQESLATDEYPLKRTIYVLNYQPNMGLGIGLSAFLTGDRGQRIVLKSGLLPATMPGREIIIRSEVN